MTLFPVPVRAAKLVLRIMAGNPSSNLTQNVRIHSELPPRVRADDVLSTAGLDLGYDVKKDVYYVHKEMELGPQESTQFDVEIRDIWQVSEEQVARFQKHAVDLVEQLKRSRYAEYSEKSDLLLAEVQRNVAALSARQAQHDINAGARPIQHIRAYETNLKVMDQVRKDIGRIENFAMAADIDPGELIGPGSDAPKPRKNMRLSETGFRTAAFNIEVKNTSARESRTIPVRRDLPKEITATDVLESGDLEVGVDAGSGLCYVYKEDVVVGPGETVRFTVLLRDKWNISGPRIEALQTEGTELLERVSAEGKYESVIRALEDILAVLEEISAEEGPEALDEKYVAHYRRQREKVDVVDQKLARIRSAMSPGATTSRLGFSPKAPTMKTTWLIIYIVLGFLAVVSLLFFFRWFGRSKAERMETGESES
ncbi:MAG: hypothetical protein HQ559_05960 [Lentisphaerae bacterium]|nr:hypothetical protein [Lentisphaerota bacterium]